MTEAKPILLIKLDRKLPPADNMYRSGGFQESMEDKFKDYHVLCIRSNKVKDTIDIEVFNLRDVREIDIETLREELKDTYASTRHREDNKGLL